MRKRNRSHVVLYLRSLHSKRAFPTSLGICGGEMEERVENTKFERTLIVLIPFSHAIKLSEKSEGKPISKT